MSRVLHVVHGETLRHRPALAAAIRQCRRMDQSRLVVVGPSLQGPGRIRLPDGRGASGALGKWLCSVDVDLLLAWDETSLPLVGAQGFPCAAVLDGLVQPEAHRSMINWVRDRRMPVLVTSPSLAEHLAAQTKGRARVQIIEPVVDPPCTMTQQVDAMQVVAHPAQRFRLRSVLDGVIRSGLTGRPVQVHADEGFWDRHQCDAMLRANGLPATQLKPAPSARWWAGPSMLGDRRGLEPVLDIAQAWVNGGNVLLPEGHGAEQVLGHRSGVLLNMDKDVGASCAALKCPASDGTASADPADAQASWTQSLRTMLCALAPVAQRS